MRPSLYPLTVSIPVQLNVSRFVCVVSAEIHHEWHEDIIAALICDLRTSFTQLTSSMGKARTAVLFVLIK